MGNISTILAALFCATAPVSSIVAAAPEAIEISQTESSKEKISSIRKAYEKGEYDAALSEIDKTYEKADLSGLIQMRQKDVPIDFQEKWEKQFLDLQKERNRELLAVLSDTDDSSFARKVRSATILLTPDQEKAFSKLNSFIAMAPNSGSNADENKLIDIDVEYEYKILHASLPGAESNPGLKTALRMEKMEKMVEASKSFQDASLKQSVRIVSDVLDTSLARAIDGVYLNDLLKNKKKPANETEEKALAILTLYQGKFSDLLKEIDSANR